VTAPAEQIEPDCLIGGEPARTAARFAVRYPYTGEQIGSAPSLGRSEVRRALDRGAAFRERLPRHERAAMLERVAGRLDREREELARLITLESGLCLKDTHHEVGRAVDVFRLAAAEALRDDGKVFACDVSASGRDRRAYTLAEPLTLVGAMTPFNHPLNQVAHKVAPAIAVGTPMVLKPSEQTPLSALRLARILADEGVPADLVAIVTADAPLVLDELLRHEAVELVSFTGSVRVGRLIAARLGYRRALLELGGNDPLIVLADADLEEAVRLATSGCFRNSGQRCTAVKRLVVAEGVADRFVAGLVEATRALRAGDPLDPATDVGTVISEDAATLVERRVLDAVAQGADLLVGGARAGALVAPTVLDRVPAACDLVRDETFGPVAPVIRAHDLDEAIAVANGTRFGLSAGVVTNDLVAVNRCIRELRCGTVNIREVPGFRSELTPFGGLKDSGLGAKEGIVEAMRAMTFTKLYTLPGP
jgi:aldehyde dehydrogenase (NAD+)